MTPFKEDDIRPDALNAAQVERFQADLRRVLARRHEFVPVPCPACEGAAADLAFVKYELPFLTCRACGTIYISPRPTPAILTEFYATSENYAYWNAFIFPASESVRRERIFRPRADRLATFCRRAGVGGTFMEVGAAFGTFCEEVRRLGLFDRVIAVEPTPDLAATCRRRGLDVIERPIEQVHLEAGAIDAIASFETIEHLFSPREFLLACARALRPGGVLVLTCPNGQGFDVTTLGPASETFDNEHLNYFNPASLARLVGDTGFDVLEVSTPGALDAELVRKSVLAGTCDLTGQPFLRRVLVDDWDRLGAAFQEFLAAHGLSSHLWMAARKQ